MKTSYVEVVIDGPRGWDVGFVQGYLNGKGTGERVFDAEGEGFDCEPLKEKLKQLLHLDSDTAHLLVPENFVADVREAVKKSTDTHRPITICHERAISGARFHFTVHVFSKEYAAKIRELFDHMPDGVKLIDSTGFDVKVDPGAEGVELYAPTHDFEMKGEGVVEGDLEGVIQVYRACRAEELIHQSAAELIPV